MTRKPAPLTKAPAKPQQAKAPPPAAGHNQPPADGQDFDGLREQLVSFFKAHQRAADAVHFALERARSLVDKAADNGNKPAELIAAYRRIRDFMEGADDPRVPDGITELMKNFTVIVEKFKWGLLPEAFERDNIGNLTIKGGDRVHIGETIRASILKDNRGKAYAWLRKNKHGDLIIETVNAGTLSAWAKEEIEANHPIPADLITVESVPTASLTRGKGK